MSVSCLSRSLELGGQGAIAPFTWSREGATSFLQTGSTARWCRHDRSWLVPGTLGTTAAIRPLSCATPGLRQPVSAGGQLGPADPAGKYGLYWLFHCKVSQVPKHKGALEKKVAHTEWLYWGFVCLLVLGFRGHVWLTHSGHIPCSVLRDQSCWDLEDYIGFEPGSASTLPAVLSLWLSFVLFF